MNSQSTLPAMMLGGCLFAGLAGLGLILGHAALEVKAHERTVQVKGLAEREVPADVVIWPITYQLAGNDLAGLYESIADKNATILRFLDDNGIGAADVSTAAPSVIDRHAQAWGDTAEIEYRYIATATVTVYSKNVDGVRRAMANAIELGKNGIALGGEQFGNQVQYLYTGLNDIKPGMIEESTVNARAVAEKFAADSASTLGRIRTASQGQFSITDRDSTTPHVKNVRVVSTVEYYLSD